MFIFPFIIALTLLKPSGSRHLFQLVRNRLYCSVFPIEECRVKVILYNIVMNLSHLSFRSAIG